MCSAAGLALVPGTLAEPSRLRGALPGHDVIVTSPSAACHGTTRDMPTARAP